LGALHGCSRSLQGPRCLFSIGGARFKGLVCSTGWHVFMAAGGFLRSSTVRHFALYRFRVRGVMMRTVVALKRITFVSSCVIHHPNHFAWPTIMVRTTIKRRGSSGASVEFFVPSLLATANHDSTTNDTRPITGRTRAGFWLSSAFVQVAFHSRLVIGSQHAHMVLHI